MAPRSGRPRRGRGAGGRRAAALAGALAAGAWLWAAAAAGNGSDVEVVVREAQRRVDVSVDGRPFTSYVYPEGLKKPVLFPLRTAAGTIVTRGFPLDPRPGERVDHPHHVGLWFNYGDVDGIDFWNNSDTIRPEQAPKMGTVVHRAVTDAAGGTGRGTLGVEMDWVRHDGTVLLRETTRFVFTAGPDARIVDRFTTLRALDAPVRLPDSKEGMLGIRVARALEAPSDRPEIFTDAAGRPTEVPAMDNTGVNGVYLSSEGRRGDEVWGTRGRWVSLSGKVDGEAVTLAILDHPQNPGYPTYWHARGYGLFAANPLGQAELSGGEERLDFALGPRESVTFRNRVLILTGPASAADLDDHQKRFAMENPE